MSAATQELIALAIVALIAGLALRGWWRSRRHAAACNGCVKSGPAQSADQAAVVKISLRTVQTEIRRNRK